MPQIPMKPVNRRCGCGCSDILFYAGQDIIYAYCNKCLHSAPHVFRTPDLQASLQAAHRNWDTH